MKPSDRQEATRWNDAVKKGRTKCGPKAKVTRYDRMAGRLKSIRAMKPRGRPTLYLEKFGARLYSYK